MDKLEQRARKRAELVRSAKDSNVYTIAELYLHEHRTALEHLKDGETVADSIPVGKERFMNWLKATIKSHFHQLSGVLENETMLKTYASQVADAIAKSDTGVQNPLKDYKVSQDPVYVKAQMSPAKAKVPPVYGTPSEQFRTDPDHPGQQLGRVRDKVYQSNIDGSFYEVTFDEGVKNQVSRHMNDSMPVKPFLADKEPKKMKQYDKKTHQVGEGERPYDVFKDNEDLITPSAPNNDPKTMEESRKEAELLTKLFRKAQEKKICETCGKEGCPCMAAGKPCTCKKAPAQKAPAADQGDEDFTVVPAVPMASSKGNTKRGQQFFGKTTMSTRSCPDHPGQQMSRVADKVYQCGLDNRVYNFAAGFATDDGVKHNGGAVEAQNSIPPGSIVIRIKASEEEKTLAKIGRTAAVETRQTHSFLYQVLQQLGVDTRERQILNYKFQHNMPLDEAIAKFEEAERLSAQQKQSQPQQPGKV